MAAAGAGRCSADKDDTLLNRSPIVRKTYADQTPGVILVDLFALAGLTEFDVTTPVDPGLAIVPVFAASGEKFTDLLDRLAVLLGASWCINQIKQVVFQPTTALPTAPFAIKALGLANFITSYPPSGSPTPDIDASDIRNRVRRSMAARCPAASRTRSLWGTAAGPSSPSPTPRCMRL